MKIYPDGHVTDEFNDAVFVEVLHSGDRVILQFGSDAVSVVLSRPQAASLGRLLLSASGRLVEIRSQQDADLLKAMLEKSQETPQ